MIRILKSSIFLLLPVMALSFLPAFGSQEEYDKVLAKLERAKEVQLKQEKKQESLERNKEEEPSQDDNIIIEETATDDTTTNQEEFIEEDNDKKPKGWTLTFDHEQLPNLNGIWVLKKKTKKRLINPVLSQPITFVHCTSRLPFEKRDFEDKEVVISLTSPNSFSVRALYPITEDVYNDPNQKKEIVYQNFDFKAVIRPEDITYAYTLKLKDFVNNPSLTRQLWLNGKLHFDHISGSKIKATGYEIEYSPECHGFVTDEIAFEFEKDRTLSGDGEGIVPGSFLIEQAANAAELHTPGDGSLLPEPNDIPNENKSLPEVLNSAKDKSNFEASNNYKPANITEELNKQQNKKDTTKDKNQNYDKNLKVPGMW